MADRAMIAVVYPDNTGRSIYAHWCEPDETGAILNEFYHSSKAVRDLMNFSNKIDGFDRENGKPKKYKHDDTYSIANTFENWEEYFNRENLAYCSYFYIFREFAHPISDEYDGTWLWRRQCEKNWRDLRGADQQKRYRNSSEWLRDEIKESAIWMLYNIQTSKRGTDNELKYLREIAKIAYLTLKDLSEGKDPVADDEFTEKLFDGTLLEESECN